MLRQPDRRLLAAAWTLGLAVLAFPLAAQISNSKHNLTASSPGVNKFSGTDDICVFCHTPIGSDESAVPPQWNRSPSPVTYQTYDTLGTSTMTGQVAPVYSVSLACLSCHDGAQAMSAVINMPSGWSAGVWTGANQVDGRLAPGIISNIGTDLRNDHPVGVQYGGGGVSAASPFGPPRNPDYRPPQSTVLNETRVWWVRMGQDSTGTRRKTDLVLYTRRHTDGYTGQTDDEPFVECASCHDPHTDSPLFLRISNGHSALCLTCHML